LDPTTAKIPWRRSGVRVLSTGFALLLTLGLLEGGARLALALLDTGAAPVQTGWNVGEGRSRVRDLVYVPDPELFFRLRPGIELAETANPRIFDVRTNALGLRGAEIARGKPPNTYRVLTVGDSCTFGSGAGDADTYPVQLERRLEAARPGVVVEVLNAGVPGFSSYQALRYLEIEGFNLDPDAIVFASGVNDSSPATAGAKRRFDPEHPLSDREYAEALRAQRGLGIARLLWRAGLWWPAAASDNETQPKRRVSPEEYQRNLDSFARQSLERGILPVIVAWPVRQQALGALDVTVAEYQDLARQVARERDIAFVDLVDVVRGRPDLFIDVVHMSPRGYGIVAEQIAARSGFPDRILP
jgi:lysophospholipase L1-like esterase